MQRNRFKQQKSLNERLKQGEPLIGAGRYSPNRNDAPGMPRSSSLRVPGVPPVQQSKLQKQPERLSARIGARPQTGQHRVTSSARRRRVSLAVEETVHNVQTSHKSLPQL